MVRAEMLFQRPPEKDAAPRFEVSTRGLFGWSSRPRTCPELEYTPFGNLHHTPSNYNANWSILRRMAATIADALHKRGRPSRYAQAVI